MNKKGFTTVELMTVIVIAGLITGSVAAFLNTHINSFQVTKSVVDVQYEAQLGMNALGKVAMESRGIYEIQASGGADQMAFSPALIDPSMVAFLNYKEVSGAYVNVIYRFKYDPANQRITYTEEVDDDLDLTSIAGAESSEYLLVDNISSWTLAPGNSSLTYGSADSIFISFDLAKRDATLSISNQFKFRNKNN